jgi:hypothetical protein
LQVAQKCDGGDGMFSMKRGKEKAEIGEAREWGTSYNSTIVRGEEVE